MKIKRFVPITNDVMFKAFFMRNTDLLKSFISVSLNLDINKIDDLVFKNTELTPSLPDDKLSRLDISLKFNETLIDIEMQMRKLDDYKERVLFYLSKMYSSRIKKKALYEQASKCVSLNILGYNMFDCEEYHSSFSMREDSRNELLTDKFSIHFLELPKVAKYKDDVTSSNDDILKMWLQVFKVKNIKELNEMKNSSNDIFSKSATAIYELCGDEDLIDEVERREEAEIAYNTEMKKQFNNGVEAGVEKGLLTALSRLMNSGMSEYEARKILNL